MPDRRQKRLVFQVGVSRTLDCDAKLPSKHAETAITKKASGRKPSRPSGALRNNGGCTDLLPGPKKHACLRYDGPLAITFLQPERKGAYQMPTTRFCCNGTETA